MEMKYVSLITLILQNGLQVIVMRYSRLSQASDGHVYLSTTAVIMTEICKLLVCFGILCYNYGLTGTINQIDAEIIQKRKETMKLAVPALLYTLQNNLLYVAISNLDPAIFQVTYQGKVLTTALCSVLMLGTKLSQQQWASLVVLMIGVVLVQLAQETPKPNAVKSNQEEQSAFLGLFAVFIACLFSGFAGVYFEKMLKESKTSLWIRNIQLAVFSIGLGMGPVLFQDYAKISSYGFFQGYNSWTWAAILMQTVGGLIVAVVVKYADNILKGFATSIAIILSCILSAFLFDFKITALFSFGALLVMAAVFVYGTFPPPKYSPIPMTETKKDQSIDDLLEGGNVKGVKNDDDNRRN